MPIKKLAVIIAIGLIAILTACGGASTQEKIYNHLEEAIALETDFEKHQNEITELEKKEQEIYGTIIDLGSDEFDEIKNASQQAIEMIEERSEKMKAEKESIHNSQDEFEKTDKLIDKLEDEKAQNKGREMYDVMMNRYKTYDTLYESYTKSLQLDKELYTMLQKEDVEQEDLTTHITKVNESIEKVLEANEKFNKDTTAYNDLKKEFYNVADIDVKYEDAQGDSKESKNDAETDEDDESPTDEK